MRACMLTHARVRQPRAFRTHEPSALPRPTTAPEHNRRDATCNMRHATRDGRDAMRRQATCVSSQASAESLLQPAAVPAASAATLGKGRHFGWRRFRDDQPEAALNAFEKRRWQARRDATRQRPDRPCSCWQTRARCKCSGGAGLSWIRSGVCAGRRRRPTAFPALPKVRLSVRCCVGVGPTFLGCTHTALHTLHCIVCASCRNETPAARHARQCVQRSVLLW